METYPAENLMNADSNITEFGEEDHHYFVDMTKLYDYLDSVCLFRYHRCPFYFNHQNRVYIFM